MTAARRLLVPVLALFVLGIPPAAGKGRDREAEVQLRFGVDMALRGAWKEAQYRFQRASELAPDDPEILNNLAVAYENNGLYSDAERTYLHALDRARTNERIRENYEHFKIFYAEYLGKKPGEGPAPAKENGPSEGAPRPGTP